MTTMQRRCRNRITRLRLNDDTWIEDEDQIGSSFSHFYSELFNSTEPKNFDSVRHPFNLSWWQFLANEGGISYAEVNSVVFYLGSNKAPGPDGFTGAFFQKYWPIVDDEVCNIIKRFFPLAFLLNKLMTLIWFSFQKLIAYQWL